MNYEYQYVFQRALGQNIILVRLLNQKIAKVSELSELKAEIQERIGSVAPVVFVELNQFGGLAYNTTNSIAANLQAQKLDIDKIFRNISINTL